MSCLVFIILGAADGDLSHSVNTGTGWIEWRGDMGRCHPEILNGSPSTEKRDRGLKSHILSMGYLNQHRNTLEVLPAQNLSFGTVVTGGFFKDVLGHCSSI